jgi:phosphoglycerate kinase
VKELKTIKDLGDINGKKVLVRADFNVPIVDHRVGDSYRIDRSINTLDLLRAKGAKIIVISHIESEEKTLYPVYDYLKGYFPIKFCKDFFTKEAELLLKELKEGEILMFENLRNNSGEKENDLDFAKKLSGFADIFINDAFAVSHRSHASLVSIPKFLPTYFGPLFVEEYENLSKAFNPKHPFTLILGGAKFKTKMPLIKSFADLSENIYIVGALANDIVKAKGFSVDRSLVSEKVDLKDLLDNPKINYPKDFIVLDKDNKTDYRKINEIQEGDYVADIGKESVEEIKQLCEKSNFVLWNGPTGNYEIGFKENTENLALFLSNFKAQNKTVILGGGDTVSSIQDLSILDKFSFVSTAGGAMLDFLANKTLPALID